MLSRRLAEHVARTGFEDLPPSTRAAAKRALLDGIGVMLGASGAEEVAPFVALARERTGSGGQSVVFGHGFAVGATDAALANGAMAHALDYEDA